MRMRRRIPALLLAVLMLMSAAAGESALRGYNKEDGYVYLHLGQYPQTEDGGIEPILWRVLTVDDEKAYLLSEYILFARAMHTSRKEYEKFGGDFAQTELCHYLNTTFAEQAFTEEDLRMLLECEDYGKVFLVTRDEMKDKKIPIRRRSRQTPVSVPGEPNGQSRTTDIRYRSIRIPRPKSGMLQIRRTSPWEKNGCTYSWPSSAHAVPGGAGLRPNPTLTSVCVPRTAGRSAGLK